MAKNLAGRIPIVQSYWSLGCCAFAAGLTRAAAPYASPAGGSTLGPLPLIDGVEYRPIWMALVDLIGS